MVVIELDSRLPKQVLERQLKMKKRNVTRRGFLGTGLAAGGAALTFPYFIPHSIFGQNAPSMRINLGIIGLGQRAYRWTSAKLIQSFLNIEDCRIVALCDVDRNYLAEPKAFVDRTYGNEACQTYTDFRRILEAQRPPW